MDRSTYKRDKRKEIMAEFLKILRTSAALVLVVAAVSVIYAFFTLGRFWPVHVFTANLVVGAFIIGAGIVLFALPVRLKKDRLLDVSTHADMQLQAKARKRARAYMLIYTGICNIIITVIGQYLLSLIWR
ncbi:MAG: hypothetical protein LBE55_06520 [Clostridiales bacterium]|jgi:hypothetical protein|nr:hypothetical protein [Clostridiales bacterium]